MFILLLRSVIQPAASWHIGNQSGPCKTSEFTQLER